MKEKLFKYFEELYRSSKHNKTNIIKRILKEEGNNNLLKDLCDSFNYYDNKKYNDGKDISTKHNLFEFNILSGLFFIRLKKHEEAEKYFMLAIEKNEELAYPYNGLGILYSDLKKNEDAEKYYKIAIEKDETFTYPLNNIAILYSELKKFEDAEKYFILSIEKDETFASPFNGLGNLYSDLKKYEDAEKYYRIAIEKDETFAYPFNGLGNLYSELKKYEDAEKYYRIAIEKDETFAYPFNGLGNLYLDLKRYEDAEKYYKIAIEKDETFIYPFNGLGNLYQELKKYEDAEKYYKIAIKKNNTYASPFNNLGNLYRIIKKYDEAEKYYKIAISKKKDNYLAYRNLIKLYIEINKTDDLIFQQFKDKIKGKETESDLYLIGKIEKTTENKEVKDKFQVEEKIDETNKNITKGFIIFIDLCGSTEFKSKKEDIWFDRLIHFYKTTEKHLRSVLESYNSNIFLLKYIGDEIMFFIEDNEEIRYSNNCIFQQKLMDFLNTLRVKLNTLYFLGRKKNFENEKENEREMISFEKNEDRIDLKICITYVDDIMKYEFEDTRKGFDILGTSVDFTARIMSLCKENMVLCNHDFYQIFCNTNYDGNFIDLGKFNELHGITEKYKKNQTIYLYNYNNIENKINKPYIERIKSKIFDELIGRLLLSNIFKKQ